MIAGTVTFGTHSQEEFKLIPNSVEVESPQPVDLYGGSARPGRGNWISQKPWTAGCTISPGRSPWSFIVSGEDGELPELEQNCINTLHGRKMPIYLDADPEYYYLGRLSVSWKYGENLDTVSIEAECDPYKYKRQETVCGYDVEETLAVNLEDTGWMPVSPLIETDSEMQLVFGNTSAVLSPGTQKVPGLVLAKGNTALTVNGTGHIEFTFREGAL